MSYNNEVLFGPIALGILKMALMVKNSVPEPNRQAPVPGSLDSCKVSPSSLVLRIELGKLRQCDAILSFPVKYKTKKIKNTTPASTPTCNSPPLTTRYVVI